MALGEYTSVRTQNEQVAAEVEKERGELVRHPEAEAAELAQMWADRACLSRWPANIADVIKDYPDLALRIHVQEELGVSPTDLPSPWVAAVLVLHVFRGRALLPLLPYLFGASTCGLPSRWEPSGCSLSERSLPGSPSGPGGSWAFGSCCSARRPPWPPT